VLINFSGNEYNGTGNGSVHYITNGKLGGGFVFDGLSDYLSVLNLSNDGVSTGWGHNGFTEKFKMNDTSLDFKELEVITSNKYLLMTGQIFQYENIENRTKEFQEFYKVMRLQKLAGKEGSKKPRQQQRKDYREDEILSKLLKSRNSNKFRKLFYEGNKEDYGGDESSADLALCNLIAFYTQEFNLIDSLFSQSALYRQKWDREDYKKWTIEKAIDRLNTLGLVELVRGD